MSIIEPENIDYRYERKFFIDNLSIHQVESMVKLNPLAFSEIYHRRYVNNIYFDTPEFLSYHDNIVGNSQRTKVRIRWYNELFGVIKNPVLEFKVKSGLVGRKVSFSLPMFELKKNFSSSQIEEIIQQSKIPEKVKLEIRCLGPTLLNRYSRKYFQSANGSYRITLDTDLVFYLIGCRNNSFLRKSIKDINVVLELKYNQYMDNNANHITNDFPFRLTKSSKYVTGIDRIYP